MAKRYDVQIEPTAHKQRKKLPGHVRQRGVSLRGVFDEAISWGSTAQASTRLLRRGLLAMTHMEVIKFLFLSVMKNLIMFRQISLTSLLTKNRVLNTLY